MHLCFKLEDQLQGPFWRDNWFLLMPRFSWSCSSANPLCWTESGSWMCSHPVPEARLRLFMTGQVESVWSASCSSLIWKSCPRWWLSWYRRFRSSRLSGSTPTRSSWTGKSAGRRWPRDPRRIGWGFATISSSWSRFRRKRRFQWAFSNMPIFPWLWSPGCRVCPR